jgi:outer membrane protein insertion porin family
MPKFFKKLIYPAVILAVFIGAQIFTLVYAEEQASDQSREQVPVKVVNVAVKGTQNVNPKDVLGVVKTKKGKEFVREVLDEDLKSIYAMNLFSNVEVDLSDVEKGVEITFIVTEKPIVDSVDFRGNEHASRRLLSEKITLKKDIAFDAKAMEDDRLKIVAIFKDKGYANVQVEAYSTVDEETGKIKVVFFVIEGQKVTIGSVDAQGIIVFPKKKILGLMSDTKRKKVLKDDLFKTDLAKITSFYRNNGYLDIKIADPQITYSEENTKVNILLNITEGVKYTVGAINFIGNNVAKSDELVKALKFKKGEIYNQEKFDQSQQNIESVYADKGYIFMQLDAKAKTNADTKLVDIDFGIEEGPLVYVGQIFITGNDKTKDYVIRREILLKEGDSFNRSKLERTQQKIYNLGFFKEVHLTPRPSGKDKVDLIFDVTEQQTNTISAGIGYSSVDKLLGTVELAIHNLYGRGQTLSVMYEIGALKKYYEISFTEPWLFGKPYSLGLGVFDKRSVKEYDYYDVNNDKIVNNYTEERKGATVNLGHNFMDFYTIGWAYKYEDVLLSGVDEANTVLKPQQDAGWQSTSSLTTSFSRDSRDNIFDASSGSNNIISAQIAGGVFGGTNNFTKYIVESSWYFKTIWKLVLALHAKAGITDRFGASGEVPIYEKFYVGGAETVRGYSYFGQIGPADGGKSMMVLNIEYKLSIPQTPIQVAIFYDAGNAWSGINHESFNLKEGIGAGIRFLTPVFPIRLDYGYGLQHQPGEEKAQWYFTIGQIF